MKEEKSVEELKEQVKVLRKICGQINPYAPLSPRIKKKAGLLQNYPMG